MSAANLPVAPPPFIRFNKICLNYECGSRSIAEKCQLVDRQLQLFKSALKDSPNLILFSGVISRKAKYFGDPTRLLAYVQHQLLPNFESANRYTFAIDFHSASLTASNTIALLLKIPQIIRCSTLEIQIYGVYRLFEVPVEAISNWLNRPPNDDERTRRKRALRITEWSIQRQSAQKLCDHLKEIFKRAKSPTVPFTFRFCYEGRRFGDNEVHTNEKTGEMFSFRKTRYGVVKIKRCKKE